MVSSPKNTTTTQKVEPWSGAMPYLTEYYAKADELFENGAPKQWDGPNIIDQSQATLDALSGTENLARNGDTSALTNATNAVNNVMTSNANAQANNTLSQLQNGTNLGTNPTDAIASMIANGQSAQAPGTYNQNYQNGALGYLQQTASGANIGNNPYLDQMVSNQQDKIAEKLKNITNPGIASQANSLGRTGSAAFASQLNNASATAANEMATVATNMYGNQYNQDVANQMSAANSYGNFSDQQEQIRQSAANNANAQFNQNNQYQMQGMNLLSNNYQNNISNMLASNDQRLNAANSQINGNNATNAQKLQAAGMSADTYNNQYLPYQQLAGVGQAADDRATADLQAQISKYETGEQQQIQNIANMINMLNGGNYNSTQTTTPVYSNTGAQVLGGLTSLLGLFALCDVREKILHSFVGYMPLKNGEKVAMFEFSYRDDPDEAHWFGPIAQELSNKMPEAVVEIDDKLHIRADLLEAA